MPRRSAERDPEPDPTPAPGKARRKIGAPSPAPRVLIVDAAGAARSVLGRALRTEPVNVEVVASVDKARVALASCAQPFDLALFDLDMPEAVDLASELREKPGASGRVRVIFTSSGPSLDNAVGALRAGALDLIVRPFDPEDAARRVVAGALSARRERERDAEVDRLRRACKRLTSSRREISRKVESLCNDLADAYQELADQMTNAAASNEFASLVRSELDVESLLRTFLEFILARTGPTNAAVFLPSNHSDFALGAYVNYDCAKDSADMLLDHLADCLAPRVQDQAGVMHWRTDEDIRRWLADDAHWLADQTALVFSCRHEGDCLAVGALFRDRRNPFSDELLLQLKPVADIFAQQLARVVRIHHRHKPEEAWPGFEREDDDAGGLAA